MLSNPSQLITRNISLIADNSTLILNHEDDQLALELTQHCPQMTALCLDYHHYLQLTQYQSNRLDIQFGHQLEPQASQKSDQFDTVIIYYPKAKNLMGYLLNLAATHLAINGQLLIVGENKGGVKSVPKQLPSYFDKPIKIDNARHCILYSSELNQAAPAINLNDWVTHYSLPTPQGELTICNLVGVFSEKRLDEGTKLLLENLTSFRGRVLDFGCGAGVIAAALLSASTKGSIDIECVDINAMALASCRLTLAANGFTGKVYPSDGLAQTEGHFDGIISNPPFHDGLTATTDIVANFVKDSVAKLKTGANWLIVANRHLPYSDLVQQNFGEIKVFAKNNRYKIYLNRKS